MIPEARVNIDIGVGYCYCHDTPMTGIVTSGNDRHLTNNFSNTHITGIVTGFCGHSSPLITGSNTHLTDNKPVSRIGDNFTGCFEGVIVTGSKNSFSG